MLYAAAAPSGSTFRNVVFDSWDPLVSLPTLSLQICRRVEKRFLLHRKAWKGTHERWFVVENMACSVVDEAAPLTTVRIPEVVTVGYVR